MSETTTPSLPFETAYELASTLRDELRDVDEITTEELQDKVLAHLQAFEGVYHSWFDEFDVLLTPTVSTVPPKIGSQAPDGDYQTVRANVLNFAAFTAPMNVSGAASMNVPLQWSADGLPVGSMFSGKRGDDGLLLSLAYELEAAQPWIDRLPSFKPA